MISFKSFVTAIHDAIMNASDSLMLKNESLFDKYFTKVTTIEKDENNNDITKTSLTPIIVTLDYPNLTPPPPKVSHLQSDETPEGNSGADELTTAANETGSQNYGTENTQIQVPLITVVPLNMHQIEKAVLTADFEIEVVDGEVQLNFTNGTQSSNKGFLKKSKTTRGKLEITISPQESSEGLKMIVDAYEASLRRQIP